MANSGLGGIAATSQLVVFGDRDLLNFGDVFRCLNAADGTLRWTVEYPALGELDYGNSPRATPLIHGDLVYLFGAFGDLNCVRMQTGEVVWSKNIRLDFGAVDKLVWGMCSSPLIVDDKLIVNPGAAEASLVALNPKTGEVIWKTSGDRAGFGSLIAATIHGKRQIIGHERASLGGWDVATGERLWKVVPEFEGDFNVPTPIVVSNRLLVTTENNGTRLYEFGNDGRINPNPVAVNEDLLPDMSTPVVIDDRVFCVWADFYCLDLNDDLKTKWIGLDDAFGNYGALFGSSNRALAIGRGGELILIDITANEFTVVSRSRLIAGANEEIYSHPAIVGNRLYIRGQKSILCLDLSTN